jgi:hypothetical protein
MRSTLAQLTVAVATVLCLLAVPVVAPGSSSQAPAAGLRHHQAPFTGALNVILARSFRSRMASPAGG